MTIPSGAKFEAVLSDRVVLYDVSHLLRTSKTKKQEKRDPKGIDTVLVHKSGADGRAGYQGVEDCVRYVIDSRDFPGMPYTYWLSRSPSVDAQNRFVVYRGQPDDIVSWHTGHRMNRRGIGIGVQGNFDGDGGPALRSPTSAQWLMLEALVDWLLVRHRIFLTKDPESLTGHWEHGKPVCPGDALVAWIRERRGEGSPRAVLPLAPKDDEVNPLKFSVEDRQRALKLLGYAAGEPDGLWGYRSRAALEAFQKDERLQVDGAWGPKTAAAILERLRGISRNTKKTFAET